MEGAKQLQSRYTQHMQPPTQHVIIRQKDPIVNVNLANMVQNYASIIYQNQEDVYYQLQQYYIPPQDNLKQTFDTDTIEFAMLIIPYYLYQGFQPSKTNPYAFVQTSIDSDQLVFQYSIKDCLVPLVLKLPADGEMSGPQLVEQFKTQFLYHAYDNITNYQNARSLNIQSSERKHIVLNSFFSSLRDFYFDTNTQKYAFQFEMTKTVMPIEDIMLEPVVQNYMQINGVTSVTLQGFDILLLPDSANQSFTERQQKFAVQMLGSRQEHINGFMFSMPDFDQNQQFIAGSVYELVTINNYSLFSTVTSANGTILSASAMHTALQSTNTNFQNVFDQAVISYSLSTPIFTASDYIYVNSSADTSTWSSDGSRHNWLDVVKRQDASARLVDSVETSPMIKTKLSALRAMQIKLCDEQGEVVYPATEYFLKVAVIFP